MYVGVHHFVRQDLVLNFDSRKKTIDPELARLGWYNVKKICISAICPISQDTFHFYFFLPLNQRRRPTLDLRFCRCLVRHVPAVFNFAGMPFKFWCSQVSISTVETNVQTCVYCLSTNTEHFDHCIFKGYLSYFKSTCTGCNLRTTHTDTCYLKDEPSHSDVLPKCVVCLEGYASVCFWPCRHANTCPDCAMQLFSKNKHNTTCPVCRTPTSHINCLQV
jgi:hypothetical protein